MLQPLVVFQRISQLITLTFHKSQLSGNNTEQYLYIQSSMAERLLKRWSLVKILFYFYVNCFNETKMDWYTSSQYEIQLHSILFSACVAMSIERLLSKYLRPDYGAHKTPGDTDVMIVLVIIQICFHAIYFLSQFCLIHDIQFAHLGFAILL